MIVQWRESSVSEPTTLSPVEPVDSVSPTTVRESSAVVSISKAELSAMLQQAVAAGAAQAPALGTVAGPVDTEKPEQWTVNQLLHYLVQQSRPFSERQARAAYAAVETHFPADTGDDTADGV